MQSLYSGGEHSRSNLGSCTDGAIGERLELCNNWLARFANSPRDRATEDAMADSTAVRRRYTSHAYYRLHSSIIDFMQSKLLCHLLLIAST